MSDCPNCAKLRADIEERDRQIMEVEYYPDGTIKRVVKRDPGNLPYVFPFGPSK